MHDPLAFYKIMNYPIPQPSHYFYYKQKQINKKTINTYHKQPDTDAMNKKIAIIQKYDRLRKHLPYIKHIYLCDSISFQAAHPGSDIDLFFITKHGCLWRARLASVIILWLLWIKRTLQKKTSLFDPIFYVDEKYTNIQTIRLKPDDIYLSHRLAHLIPLYQSTKYNIYKDNQRLQKELPNFPMQHTAQIKIPIQQWSSIWKKFREKLQGTMADNFWEQLRRQTRKPLVIRKQNRRNDSEKWVIINNNILKFHKDKRWEIQNKRNRKISTK